MAKIRESRRGSAGGWVLVVSSTCSDARWQEHRRARGCGRGPLMTCAVLARMATAAALGRFGHGPGPDDRAEAAMRLVLVVGWPRQAGYAPPTRLRPRAARGPRPVGGVSGHPRRSTVEDESRGLGWNLVTWSGPRPTRPSRRELRGGQSSKASAGHSGRTAAKRAMRSAAAWAWMGRRQPTSTTPCACRCIACARPISRRPRIGQ